jgi:hypothetical protein
MAEEAGSATSAYQEQQGLHIAGQHSTEIHGTAALHKQHCTKSTAQNSSSHTALHNNSLCLLLSMDMKLRGSPAGWNTGSRKGGAHVCHRDDAERL